MKVLIVDDSAVFRMAIRSALEEVEGIEIVGAFANGKLVIEYLEKGKPVDLITLDMEMPVMDGQTTIQEIRKINQKVPIIVFSSQTIRGAEKTIDALSHGANDFVTKEMAGGGLAMEKGLETIKEALLPKIKALNATLVPKTSVANHAPQAPTKQAGPFYMARKPRLILIASSTGGPEALGKVFEKLNENMANVPILLVQHMPPIFTKKLGEMLSKKCPGYEIVEGHPGAELRPNTCYIAPGDFHMTLGADQKVALDQGEKVCFVRPAANCLFDSVAKNYSGQTATFVLTGMGEDGADGVRNLANKGSYCFYQDKDSCIVFGMPGAVEKTGVAKELTLEEIAETINTINSRP